MRAWIQLIGFVALAFQLLTPVTTTAKETSLFNGKDLEGWSFRQHGDNPVEVQDPWIVQRGLLICRGVAAGYLIHQDEFEDYVLTFDLRTMSTEEGHGMAIGSLGSVFINAVPEEGSFHAPKSIEISLRDPGNVFFRDLDQESKHDSKTWVFRAPDFADDVERDMGEWNRVKLISNGTRLTVILNDQVINQVEPINRTKGAVAIKSDRGFAAAPTFYRNLLIRPIDKADLAAEKVAATRFAHIKRALAKRVADEEAERAEAERMQAEAQKELASEWSDTQVVQDIEFKANIQALPYPSDVREISFRSLFGMIGFESQLSLSALSKFYSTEMSRRGWKVTETDIEEDEVTVTFLHGQAEVEINLDELSDGVEVSLDCEGLSFDGTDDPASLVKQGVPQPNAYLILQRELQLPTSYRDEEYDMGSRRLFKSTLSLPKLYGFLTEQLRLKGYRETRRPIISNDRQYSEFAKGRIEISVNTFSHEIGSRVVLSIDEN